MPTILTVMKHWGVCPQLPGERIGVVGGPGDRRDEDFVTLGKLSAGIFDRLIIKEDDDTRGRSRGSGAELITKGILQVKPDYHYQTTLDETQAINLALDSAPSGSLVVILPENVNRAISLIEARHPISEEAPRLVDTTAINPQISVKSSVANQF